MAFPVLLTSDAARDLEEIFAYIQRQDGQGRAEKVLGQIERVFATLRENPHRGVVPRELLELGIRAYREVFFKPYRIIYRAEEEGVVVLVIADGRRDMESLLQRRLLQP